MSDSVLSPSAPDSAKPTRRRYTQAYKRQVVEQSLQPGTSAAQVAREHKINANLLHAWRWHYRSGLLSEASAQEATELIPVQLSSATSGDLTSSVTERLLSIRCGELHITLQGEVDPATLQTVLASLLA
ncbi:MAG: IS66-like element accessory protein TnpA [Burkholderiaceae bacterium]|jgi:transposase